MRSRMLWICPLARGSRHDRYMSKTACTWVIRWVDVMELELLVLDASSLCH